MFQNFRIIILLFIASILNATTIDQYIREGSSVDLTQGSKVTNMPYGYFIGQFGKSSIKGYDQENLSAYEDKKLLIGYGVYDIKDQNCRYLDVPSNNTFKIAFDKIFTLNNATYAISRDKMTYSQCLAKVAGYSGFVFTPKSVSEMGAAIRHFGEDKDMWIGYSKSDCNSAYKNNENYEQSYENFTYPVEVCTDNNKFTYSPENSLQWLRTNQTDLHYCPIKINSPDYLRPIKFCMPWWRVERQWKLDSNADIFEYNGEKYDLRYMQYIIDYPKEEVICSLMDSNSSNDNQIEKNYEITCNSYDSINESPTCIDDITQDICHVNECKGYIENVCVKKDTYTPFKDYDVGYILVDGIETRVKTKENKQIHTYKCPQPSQSIDHCLQKEIVTVFPVHCPGSKCDELSSCLQDRNNTLENCLSLYPCEKNYGSVDNIIRDENGLATALGGLCSDGSQIEATIEFKNRTKKTCLSYDEFNQTEQNYKTCISDSINSNKIVSTSITADDEYSLNQRCIRTNNLEDARPSIETVFEYTTKGFFKTNIKKAYIDGTEENNDTNASDYILAAATMELERYDSQQEITVSENYDGQEFCEAKYSTSWMSTRFEQLSPEGSLKSIIGFLPQTNTDGIIQKCKSNGVIVNNQCELDAKEEIGEDEVIDREINYTEAILNDSFNGNSYEDYTFNRLSTESYLVKVHLHSDGSSPDNYLHIRSSDDSAELYKNDDSGNGIWGGDKYDSYKEFSINLDFIVRSAQYAGKSNTGDVVITVQSDKAFTLGGTSSTIYYKDCPADFSPNGGKCIKGTVNYTCTDYNGYDLNSTTKKCVSKDIYYNYPIVAISSDKSQCDSYKTTLGFETNTNSLVFFEDYNFGLLGIGASQISNKDYCIIGGYKSIEDQYFNLINVLPNNDGIKYSYAINTTNDECESHAKCFGAEVISNCNLRVDDESATDEGIQEISSYQNAAPILLQEEEGTFVGDINGYSDVFAVQEYLDGEFGYISNYITKLPKNNIVMIDQREISPIIEQSPILYPLLYDYYQSQNNQITKNRTPDNHSSGASGISILTTFIGDNKVFNSTFISNVYEIGLAPVMMLFGKKQKWGWYESDYKLYQKYLAGDKYVPNIYGNDPRLIEEGEFIWDYESVRSGTMSSGNYSAFRSGIINSKKDRFAFMGFDEDTINNILISSNEKNAIGWPGIKWYKTSAKKTNRSSESKNEVNVKKQINTVFLGAVNFVSIVVPYKGDYEVKAYDANDNLLGTKVVEEQNFLSNTPATSGNIAQTYAKVQFATADDFNIAPGQNRNLDNGSCLSSNFVEWGGGVSGAYYEKGLPDLGLGSDCFKSNDSYVKSHSAVKLTLRATNSNTVFVINLKKPMPYPNRIIFVNLMQLENRKYECWTDIETCTVSNIELNTSE